MKEIARLKMQNYVPRTKLIEALNESGYGTRIIEEKDPASLFINGKIHIVIVYEEKIKGEP